MRSRRARKSSGVDVTPLIDVLFMLIIFFVLTTTFSRGALDVDLPNASTAESRREEASVLLISKDGSLFWNGDPIDRADLPTIAAARSGDITIEGDSAAPYGTVAEVLAELAAAGVDGVSLAFDPSGDGR